jgi:hypothetical protein
MAREKSRRAAPDGSRSWPAGSTLAFSAGKDMFSDAVIVASNHEKTKFAQIGGFQIHAH